MEFRFHSRPARLAVVLSAAVPAIILFQAPMASMAGTDSSCRPWQALHTTGPDDQPYVVRNKPSVNHNDQGMCVSVTSPAGFTVTRSPGIQSSPLVRAYPYIGTGCFAGACAGPSPAQLPRAGALGNYTVSWSAVTRPKSGVWNSSLDLWLGSASGVGTSEVMIWLRYSKPSWWKNLYPAVKIDGARWYEVPHATPSGKHYISFRRATPTDSATLRIAPFMTAARKLGAVTPDELLWSAQAGFEIWSGGRGLAINSFSVTS